MPEEDHIRRPNAEEMLQSYVSDTLDYFDTVTGAFCNENSKWRLERETELKLMRDIKERASRLNLGFLQVFQSKDIGKAFWEYICNLLFRGSKRKQLEKELATVLKNTLEGVEKLTCFLDAVEKLAATSLQVFTGGEEVVKLSGGISLESLEDIISAARLVRPLLLHFKRDAEVFFRLSLHNVAFFEAELERYIDTTEKICTMMDKSSQNLTLDVVQNISSHIDQLSDISECLPRMLQFLDEMEDCAVQLDRMSKGSKISTVAGSSMGAVGGVMTLVGLALAPVTAGVSLGLTMGGVGLRLASSVISLVTTVTETVVNEKQKMRAMKALQSFMKDAEKIQARLVEVINQMERKLGTDYWAIVKAIRSAIKTFVGFTSAFRKISKLFAKISTKNMMAVGIGLKVFSICWNIYTIYKESISLARGEQSEASKFIRAYVVLRRSEVDCWTRIHDSAGTGMK
uniref:Apolipoprotein L n=1 Tax=Gadus morhua TaxID=8049 RepID=A0A8C5FF93_GADMO